MTSTSDIPVRLDLLYSNPDPDANDPTEAELLNAQYPLYQKQHTYDKELIYLVAPKKALEVLSIQDKLSCCVVFLAHSVMLLDLDMYTFVAAWAKKLGKSPEQTFEEHTFRADKATANTLANEHMLIKMLRHYHFRANFQATEKDTVETSPSKTDVKFHFEDDHALDFILNFASVKSA